MSPLDTARRYAGLGLCVIPCSPRSKRPALRSWKAYQKRHPTDDELSEWFGRGEKNIAIVTGAVSGVVAIDVDSDEARAWAEAHLPPSPMRTRTAKGEHWLYRHPGEPVSNRVRIRGDGGELALDVRGDGGYVLAGGSMHPTGFRYQEIGQWTPAALKDLPVFDPAWVAGPERDVEEQTGDSAQRATGNAGPDVLERARRYAANCNHAISGSGGHATAMRVVGAVVRGFDLSDGEALEVLAEWNAACTPPWSESELLHKISEAQKTPDPKGRARGWLLSSERTQDREHAGDDSGRTGTAVGGQPTFAKTTDTGNSERLVHDHGRDIRFVHPWKAWLVWDGHRWAEDKSGAIQRRAKATVRAIYEEAAKARAVVGGEEGARLAKMLSQHAFKSESAARRKAMVELAQAESSVTALPADFDPDSWSFNVQNGTVDLRTGELRRHRRDDLCTKLSPVVFDPKAECPIWLAFLDRIFAGDQDLISYLQRFAGYSLSGATTEQALEVWHGVGANGKSTACNALREVLGDYAQHAETATFMERRNDGPRDDLADLHGARFVSMAETKSGRRLDEGLVKQGTGGDPIRCRKLYSSYFEYIPTFKLVLLTNHRPVVRGVDTGIWRRLHLIPFQVVIPKGERDRHLPGKLRTESGGILAWAVRGCLEWQRNGLEPPRAVLAATDDYRREMDELGDFFDEVCVLDERATEAAARLYSAYRMWCEKNGATALSRTKFGRELGARGFKKRKKGTISSDGIALLDRWTDGLSRRPISLVFSRDGTLPKRESNRPTVQRTDKGLEERIATHCDSRSPLARGGVA